MEHFGFSISGAAAEYFVARPEWLHHVPDELTDTQAALVEPFSCAYFAAMRADNLNASDTAVVFGAGPIGLSCVAVASTLGARVIAAEPNAARARPGPRLGAEEVVDPTADGLRRARAGADRRAGRRRGDGGLRPAGGHGSRPSRSPASTPGWSTSASTSAAAPTAQLGLIQSKQLQIRGTIGSPGVWPQTLRFLARTGLDLSPMVTQRFDLADAPDAYDAARRTDENVKVHIENGSTPMKALVLHAAGDARIEDRPDAAAARARRGDACGSSGPGSAAPTPASTPPVR